MNILSKRFFQYISFLTSIHLNCIWRNWSQMLLWFVSRGLNVHFHNCTSNTLLTSQHILQLTECVKIKDYIFQLHMHTHNQCTFFKKNYYSRTLKNPVIFFPQTKLKEWKTHVYLTFPDINQIWTTDLQTSFAKTRRSNGWLLSKLLTSKIADWIKQTFVALLCQRRQYGSKRRPELAILKLWV